MRVVCPHAGAGPDPRTLASLPSEAVLWPVDDGDGYWRLLAHLWDVEGAWLIVEHDIVVPAGLADEMASCPEPWCYAPYPGWPPDTLIEEGLGCVKIGGRAIAGSFALPWLFTDRDWRRLDVQLASGLRRAGLEPHRHATLVEHLHVYGEPVRVGACRT